MAIESVTLGEDTDGEETLTITENGQDFTIRSESFLALHKEIVAELFRTKKFRDEQLLFGSDASQLAARVIVLRLRVMRLNAILVLYNQAKGL